MSFTTDFGLQGLETATYTWIPTAFTFTLSCAFEEVIFLIEVVEVGLNLRLVCVIGILDLQKSKVSIRKMKK